MSDRIAVMNLGHVLQVGPPAEIYERPASRFVADFIGETNFLEGRVAAVEREWATVAMDVLPVMSSYARRPAVGDRVTVAVRPEKVRISRGRLEGPNAFEGRIEGMTYVGKDSDYRVRIGRETQLRVRIQNETTDGADVPGVGEAIWVQWPPASGRLLEE